MRAKEYLSGSGSGQRQVIQLGNIKAWQRAGEFTEDFRWERGKMKWNKYPDMKPTEEKQYITAVQTSKKVYYDISKWTNNLHEIVRYGSFSCEEEEKEHGGFYGYDSSGYYSMVVDYWAEIEPLEVEK